MDRPIDIVIAWVDGSDPAWLLERAKYAPAGVTPHSARFRDWGLLRCWFRGVETYAPWVNRVHFVTWGHVPAWLNLDCPKLNIVRHEDYIPAAYLPTFSSHPIELNLHHIPGLAERFIYFNDDMFLTRPVQPEEFFVGDRPCDTYGLDCVHFGKETIAHIVGASISVINDHFDKKSVIRAHARQWYSPANGLRRVKHTLMLSAYPYFPGIFFQHGTSSFLKATFDAVWRAEPALLDATCRDRFRQPTNVNQWLMKFWQLVEGVSVPAHSDETRCFHMRGDVLGDLTDAIRRRRFQQICINDTEETVDYERQAAAIAAAFEETLPARSAFERS